MAPSPTTIAIHALNVLIGVLSIAILALVARSVSLTDSPSSVLPNNVRGTGRGLLFWPGCGGIVDMLLFTFLWIKTPEKHEQTKKRHWLLNAQVFVACFIFGRPLIVLIYTVVEYNTASKLRLPLSAGNWTIETWSCAYSDHVVSGNPESVCKELRTARYLLVPEVVLGASLLGVVLWSRFPAC
ncbi:hypothetical protein EK21DRAFT_96563 [Setomelanomma holmii]|uniref:Uncharacterized protein n=1 Tax=Setomelanomma holmii TaxID=210430 RepID=A0A9P4LTN5_9PLEO|nr:hypothetical protein EK21DRAFT_96563 [Setomelanomma holmii]